MSASKLKSLPAKDPKYSKVWLRPIRYVIVDIIKRPPKKKQTKIYIFNAKG